MNVAFKLRASGNLACAFQRAVATLSRERRAKKVHARCIGKFPGKRGLDDGIVRYPVKWPSVRGSPHTL